MNFFSLTSDQIKKLALSAMGFIFLLYAYFTFFLGPLNKSRHQAQVSIDELQHKLATSKNEMQKAANLERQAKDATTRFAALKALAPDGAPIAWFPPRMKTFFADRRIDKATAHLEGNSTFKEGDLAGWTKYNWLIDLPQSDYISVGQAIADLENAEPLLSIAR